MKKCNLAEFQKAILNISPDKEAAPLFEGVQNSYTLSKNFSN
jgi:hypothetical protein